MVQSLTRTTRVLPLQSPVFSASTIRCRALSLTSGAQASSRSRNTWSAGRPWAFSRKRGLLPGTARQDRRGRSRRCGRDLCGRRLGGRCGGHGGSRHPSIVGTGSRPWARRISSTMRPTMAVISKSAGVKTAATPWARSACGVGGRDDPADHHRDVARAGLAEPPQHVGHQLGVPAGQDRQAHAVHVLGHRRGRDLRRGEPDAGVDHLEPGVAGPDGDLLDAVGVPVEAGLAQQQAQPARPDLGRGGVCRLADRGEREPAAAAAAENAPTPVGARYSPNTSRSAKAHSPVVTPARAQASVAAIRLTSGSSASALSRASAARTAAGSRRCRHRARSASTACS